MGIKLNLYCKHIDEGCANKSPLKSIHSLALAWVRIASSVQSSAGGALIGIKGAGIRIGSRRCAYSRCTTTHACTLEATRTQASPDLCSESKWWIAFNFYLHTPNLSSTAFYYV